MSRREPGCDHPWSWEVRSRHSLSDSHCFIFRFLGPAVSLLNQPDGSETFGPFLKKNCISSLALFAGIVIVIEMPAPLSCFDYLAKLWAALVLATPGLEDGLPPGLPTAHLIDWASRFILGKKKARKGLWGKSEAPAMCPKT